MFTQFNEPWQVKKPSKQIVMLYFKTCVFSLNKRPISRIFHINKNNLTYTISYSPDSISRLYFTRKEDGVELKLLTPPISWPQKSPEIEIDLVQELEALLQILSDKNVSVVEDLTKYSITITTKNRTTIKLARQLFIEADDASVPIIRGSA